MELDPIKKMLQISTTPQESSGITQEKGKAGETVEVTRYQMLSTVFDHLEPDTVVKREQLTIQRDDSQELAKSAEGMASRVKRGSGSGRKGSSERAIERSKTDEAKWIYHTKQDVLPWMTNIHDAGDRALRFVYQQFVDKVNQDPNLTPKDKTAILDTAKQYFDTIKKDADAARKATVDSPMFKDSPNEPLLPDKELIAKFKGVSKGIEETVHHEIQRLAGSLGQVCAKYILDHKSLSAANSDSYYKLGIALGNDAKKIEGRMRYEIIHEDPMWDPTKTTSRYMSLSNTLLGVSSFHAAGPGVSSQEACNRSADESFARNYFDTTFEIKDSVTGNQEVVFEATRSAVTVEFDQANEAERQQCNDRMVLQILNGQAAKLVAKTAPEELARAESPDHPLVLTSTTVNLLTPDVLRDFAATNETFKNIGQKIYHQLSGAAADNERNLAEQNLATHQRLNGKVLQIKFTDENGVDRTVHVKVDLRYMNIPNNKMNEQLPGFLTFSKSITEANNASWNKLERDATKAIQDGIEKTSKAYKSLPVEDQKKAEKLLLLLIDKAATRREIMQTMLESNFSLLSKFDKTEAQFKAWQQMGKTFSEMASQLEADPATSPQLLALINQLKHQDQLVDLFFDTRELFKSGLSKNVENMDNNYSALATRMILLSSLLTKTNFGCRSGKDRTGLVDTEIKLLLALAHKHGRMPSYREQEKENVFPDIHEMRRKILLESGNTFDFVKANLGAAVGLNTGGSRSKPLESNPGAELHVLANDSAEAFSKIASRAPGRAKPAHLDYWQAKDRGR
jgi:hypothetical protein